MLAKREFTYDVAIGFESSFYDIFVDLSKVNSKIHHVLSCKRLNKYYKMLRKEDDYNYDYNVDL